MSGPPPTTSTALALVAQPDAMLAEFDHGLNAGCRLHEIHPTLAETVDELINGHNWAETIRGAVERQRLAQHYADEWTKLSIEAARKASPLIDALTRPGKPSHDGTVTLTSLGMSRSQAGRWRKLARLSDLGLEAHYRKLERSGHPITIKSALDLYERSHGREHPNNRRARLAMLGPCCPTCGRPFPKRKPVTGREIAEANRILHAQRRAEAAP